MKKLSLAALFFTLLFLTGCSFPPVLRRLPDYESGELHSCSGGQDSTDYGKYVFSDVTAQQLQITGYFQKVTAADLDVLRQYVKDFEQWVEICSCDNCGCDLAECYDFSAELLEAGDCFGLERSEPRGSFLGDYTIYYFDTDTQTLYYLRSNI